MNENQRLADEIVKNFINNSYTEVRVLTLMISRLYFNNIHVRSKVDKF